MLSLKYNTGSGTGTFTIDLDMFLPCSKKDFSKVLDMVHMSTDPEYNASALYAHISEKIDMFTHDRALLDPERQKDELTKVNSIIKKYISLSGMLSKEYGFENKSDDAAEITLKKSEVHVFRRENGQNVFKTFDGWMFEKSGYTFYVYADGSGKEKTYRICLYGLMVKEVSKKSNVISEISPAVIETLIKNNKRIDQYKSDYEKAMNAAGSFRDETPAADPEPIQDETPAADPESIQDETTAADPEPKKTAFPEKTFIGQHIIGSGYDIFFDPETQRTRIILTNKKLIPIVEEAGFYYSKLMNSWNKKLTFKAYRKALKVAEELNAA